jgi:hypothetical protein
VTLADRIAQLRGDLRDLEIAICDAHQRRWRPRAIRLLLIAASRRVELRALSGLPAEEGMDA